MNEPNTTNDEPRRCFSGRFLVFAVVLLLGWTALLAVNMMREADALRDQLPGDGVHIESYGFDLSNLTVPRHLVVSGGFSKDAVHALTDPQSLPVEEMREINSRLRRMHKGKYIVDTDRVIGITLDGQSRAYPLRFMYWHEVVNDTLGGVPVAVTYHGLCDSAVVFDRRVGGEKLEFGVSGLLYNSNQLLYDRRAEPKDESLWSQLLFKPIAGPAVDRGAELKALPMTVTTWGDWLKQHPDTTILRGVNEYFDSHYKKHPFQRYWQEKKTVFPVEPEVEDDSPIKAFDHVRKLDGRVHCFHFAWHAIRGE